MYVIVVFLSPEDIKKYDFDDVYLLVQTLNYQAGQEKIKDFLHTHFHGVENIELSLDGEKVVYGEFSTVKLKNNKREALHWELEVHKAVDFV